ncbi:MAG: histidine kinase [Mucilaginibacter sp.]|nr:histidine kinase [Mucilaginibacter sp.]
MSDFTVDLSNCDREPIHIPGQLQSHGFLIVIDQNYTISFFSDNIGSFIAGISIDLLGKPLEYLEKFLGLQYNADYIKKLLNTERDSKSFERINPVTIDLSGKPFYLIISVSDEYTLLEFEPAISDFNLNVQSLIGRSIAEILGFKEMQKLLDHTTSQVRNIIHYDRVMIYRFGEDGHGEVVAEAKNEDLNPWLGLHYPASDIPKQARELYKLNLTRLIANVHTTPSLITASADHTEPLDLTFSQLRAVSPIHIQYLKNMGVASSFSISLIYKGELWGLIACHNYTPLFIDYRSREYAKLIGQILSSALEFRQDEESLHNQEGFKNNLDKIARSLQNNEHIADALISGSSDLLNVVKATGAVVLYEKKQIKIGITPDDAQLELLIRWIMENVNEPVYYTHKLSGIYPEAANYKEIASGMMVTVLYSELKEYIIWFKPEKLQTINWAGNPQKPAVTNAEGLMQISPRHSFEVWSETVSGASDSWSGVEINSVTRLKEEITNAVNLKAGAIRLLNEKLRSAYEELETFSYTISHDLKNPLASIKSYAQLLIRDQQLAERGQSLLQRIADRADQMNLMINAVLDYSRLGRSELKYRKINTGLLIADIVSDLDMMYDTANFKITIGDTPDLVGDPIMMLQVFSNLIGNAVKYSQNARPAIIHIEGITRENDICYKISDNGLGIAAEDIPRIFELFNRMDNVKDIEGPGVGLAIVKRIVERHKGKIWAESVLNKGSEFFVSFNK